MESQAQVGAGSISVALQAAQARLLQLRAAFSDGVLPAPQLLRCSANQPTSDLCRQGQRLLTQRRIAAGVGKVETPMAPVGPTAVSWPSYPIISAAITTPTTIKVYPSLTLAMLQQQLEAPGRVYWLLRGLDTAGRGWVTLADVREQLAGAKAAWRVCGWRRLRQLLTQGEGLFWQRDVNGRLWLYGVVRVAQALGVVRLAGQPVQLTVAQLCGSIQTVRAHFYAAMHSSRGANGSHWPARPISRRCLADLSGVPARTQRLYDNVARVRRQGNVAVGPRCLASYAPNYTLQAQIWQRGRGVFEFVDSHGRQGQAGRRYVAWRLPNSYEGIHTRRARGRQKKANRKLADLVQKGMRGNAQRPIRRQFWPQGAAAAQAYNRYGQDAYWPANQPLRQGVGLWRVLAEESRY